MPGVFLPPALIRNVTAKSFVTLRKIKILWSMSNWILWSPVRQASAGQECEAMCGTLRER